MKRAPFIITGTIVGLAGVLSFRSTPAKISLGALPTSAVVKNATTSQSTTTATGSPGSSTTSPPSTTRATTSPPTTVPTRRASTTTTPTTTTPTTTVPVTTAPTTRTAVGPSVNYYFGILSVSVTATGTRVQKVTIHSINDGGNPRSQYIDQASIPMLEQQALAAQNANIQGVSGASYTSAGFKMSLQGALKQLGIK
ncbi:MAG TPA: FMN-binding protein [Acidimicrobiales bacterium]|nr:FMN-binding protein [Acidimicrobiales bacterium]